MDTAKLTAMETRIQSAWDWTLENLYDAEHHMIYDFATGDSLEETIANLPTPEEIAHSVPNPCGWGTGMEDSTLSIGPLLEAVLIRRQYEDEPALKKLSDSLIQGLIINGTAAEPGFIARCVSPADGTSVYMDSSRDQYTNWVYAAHLLLRSALVEETQKKAVSRILVQVAEKAERDVTSDNKGYLLRLDGKPGMVSQMFSADLGAHEFLRLPMFYLAAWEASGDPHWMEKYRAVRDICLDWCEQTFLPGNVSSYGYIYGIYQHQYSAKLLYDLEEDPAYRVRYAMLMKIAAEVAEHYIKDSYRNIGSITVPEQKMLPWRERPARYLGMFYGVPYYAPPVGTEIFRHMRNASEVIIIQCLCPGYQIPQWEKEMFYEFVERARFTEANSYWPLLFCDAWWLMKHSDQLN